MDKQERRFRNQVFVTLDRKRRLKYSLESYREILRNLQISKGNSALVEMMLNRLDLRYLSVFLWAGLSWEDPMLHLVKVENILVQFEKDSAKLKEIEQAVVKALKNAVKGIGQHSEN